MNFYKLILLRHAESVGNAEGYYQGQEDFPLTRRGVNQVRRLISRWRIDATTIDRVITSQSAPVVVRHETLDMKNSAMKLQLSKLNASDNQVSMP